MVLGTIHDLLFRIRICLGRKIMWDERRIIVQVSPKRIVKGPCSLQEQEALEFLSKHTSVLMPRVHKIHRRKAGDFIEMEYVEGRKLDDVWPTCAATEREHIVAQVCAHLRQLRALGRPSSLGELVAGSAISGRGLRDGVFGEDEVGPFTSKDEFYRAIRDNPNIRPLRSGDAANDSASDDTVFTHADLAPRNIICRGDGTICFVDWEFAGWWPAWWERMKCNFADFPPVPGWLEQMNDAFRTQVDTGRTA